MTRPTRSFVTPSMMPISATLMRKKVRRSGMRESSNKKSPGW